MFGVIPCFACQLLPPPLIFNFFYYKNGVIFLVSNANFRFGYVKLMLDLPCRVKIGAIKR